MDAQLVMLSPGELLLTHVGFIVRRTIVVREQHWNFPVDCLDSRDHDGIVLVIAVEGERNHPTVLIVGRWTIGWTIIWNAVSLAGS